MLTIQDCHLRYVLDYLSLGSTLSESNHSIYNVLLWNPQAFLSEVEELYSQNILKISSNLAWEKQTPTSSKYIAHTTRYL